MDRIMHVFAPIIFMAGLISGLVGLVTIIDKMIDKLAS
jgi:hypothetical protein